MAEKKIRVLLAKKRMARSAGVSRVVKGNFFIQFVAGKLNGLDVGYNYKVPAVHRRRVNGLNFSNK